MKKHHNYTPQHREPRPLSAQGNVPQPEIGPTEPSYEQLESIFYGYEKGDEPTIASLVGQRQLVAVASLVEGGIQDSDRRLSSLLSAKAVHEAVDFYNTKLGLKVAEDNLAISALKQNSISLLYTQNTLQAELEKIAERPFDEQLVFGAISSIFDGMKNSGSASAMAASALEAEKRAFLVDIPEGTDSRAVEAYKASEEYANMRIAFLRRGSHEPRALSKETNRILAELSSPAMRKFVTRELERFDNDWLAWQGGMPDEVATSVDANTDEEQAFGGLELDYSILPEGSTLEEFTREILEKMSEKLRPYVDLRRIAVLDTLKRQIGLDRCFYVRGKSRGPGVVDDDGQRVSEEYIGLVVRDYDNDGFIVGENVVVTSPIAKKNAGYIVRHDVSLKPWQEVLKKPKKTAREEGARPVKFTSVKDEDTYDAYLKKVNVLLTCPPEQFGTAYELRRNPAGEYRMYKRQFLSVGELAIKLS